MLSCSADINKMPQEIIEKVHKNVSFSLYF